MGIIGSSSCGVAGEENWAQQQKTLADLVSVQSLREDKLGFVVIYVGGERRDGMDSGEIWGRMACKIMKFLNFTCRIASTDCMNWEFGFLMQFLELFMHGSGEILFSGFGQCKELGWVTWDAWVRFQSTFQRFGSLGPGFYCYIGFDIHSDVLIIVWLICGTYELQSLI